MYSILAILCITGTRCRSGQCTRRINFFSLHGANCHEHWTHTAPLLQPCFSIWCLSESFHTEECLPISSCTPIFGSLSAALITSYLDLREKSFCLPLLSLHNTHTDHSHIQQQQQLSLQLKTRTEERSLCL